MAEDGIVGDYNGSQAREVVISLADWETMQAGSEVASSGPPAAARKNRIRRDESGEENEDAMELPPTSLWASGAPSAKPIRMVKAESPIQSPLRSAITSVSDENSHEDHEDLADPEEDVEWEDVDDT